MHTAEARHNSEPIRATVPQKGRSQVSPPSTAATAALPPGPPSAPRMIGRDRTCARFPKQLCARACSVWYGTHASSNAQRLHVRSLTAGNVLRPPSSCICASLMNLDDRACSLATLDDHIIYSTFRVQPYSWRNAHPQVAAAGVAAADA
jgi:hypothetical protein